MGDVHAKYNQKRRGDKGKVGEELEKKELRSWALRAGNIKGDAHDCKNNPDLGNIVDQTA
jgi:hypothetical protein